MLLKLCAKHGRLILVASLVTGLLSKDLARLIEPHIGILIALLLFTACLRVGPQQAMGAFAYIGKSLIFTIILQVALPLLVALLAKVLGIHNTLVFALVLFTAAPALSGSPHLVALMGFDPAPALRQLVISTALLPLTVLPVFLFLPELGSAAVIVSSVVRLLMVIAMAAIAAFTIRMTILKTLDTGQVELIDGASTIFMAIIVVGLMAAIGKEFATNPYNVLTTLAAAIVANFGLQIVTTIAVSKTGGSPWTVPIGVIAGNRNVALFLTALPIDAIQPLLLFIACYQIPMYLTPLVMQRFYRRF
ncbi:MAG TPA: hypothetical protein ENJ55_00050 [Rhizobiales bacterium]|nr:hypothetical protein [Hyphomicrobiales bacterium]